MIDKITEASLLYDFYGQLLTERKQQVMELYHEENLSLGEIADEFQISRAAVHDSLKTAEKSLTEYEEKLGLVAKFVKTNEVMTNIDKMLDSLAMTYKENQELMKSLKKIKSIINGLED